MTFVWKAWDGTRRLSSMGNAHLMNVYRFLERMTGPEREEQRLAVQEELLRRGLILSSFQLGPKIRWRITNDQLNAMLDEQSELVEQIRKLADERDQLKATLNDEATRAMSLVNMCNSQRRDMQIALDLLESMYAIIANVDGRPLASAWCRARDKASQLYHQLVTRLKGQGLFEDECDAPDVSDSAVAGLESMGMIRDARAEGRPDPIRQLPKASRPVQITDVESVRETHRNAIDAIKGNTPVVHALRFLLRRAVLKS